MEDYNNTTVLVTGATGFLARHLVPELLRRGAKVAGISLGISLDKTPNQDFNNFSYFMADLKNKSMVDSIIKKIRPKKIFHLAACPDMEPSFENTDKCIQDNIQGTLNLIHSLKNVDYDSFIHMGSYKEYFGNKVPFKETDALFPISSYAISKACAEMFCKAYHRIYGLPLMSLRLPTVYGPGQPKQNLIPYLINSSLSGSPLKLTKGEQKRELIYISDVIGALIKAGVSKKAYGEVINVGTNKEYSLKEIISMALKLTNSKIEPELGAIPYRKNEIWGMKGDNSKAKNILNWKPKIDVKEGLIRTIAYYKNDSKKIK